LCFKTSRQRIFTQKIFKNGETSQKRRFAAESVCHLWAAFFVAEKMGESVGGGQVLQRPLSAGTAFLMR
jgi:hypothetical protein